MTDPPTTTITHAEIDDMLQGIPTEAQIAAALTELERPDLLRMVQDIKETMRAIGYAQKVWRYISGSIDGHEWLIPAAREAILRGDSLAEFRDHAIMFEMPIRFVDVEEES